MAEGVVVFKVEGRDEAADEEHCRLVDSTERLFVRLFECIPSCRVDRAVGFSTVGIRPNAKRTKERTKQLLMDF
jgi:hypothetical protein